jgi:rod shape determining protein RodA
MNSLSNFDWISFIILTIIMAVGIINLASIDSHFAKKQLIFDAVAIIFFFAFSFFDYRNLKYITEFFYVVILLLLMGVLITHVNGSSRWINLRVFSIQPSEFAKLALVLFIAKVLNLIGSKEYLSVVLTTIGAIVYTGLVFIEPDLGTSIEFILIWFFMVVFMNFDWKISATIIILFVLISVIGFEFMKDYQKARILAFLNPYEDPYGRGYNVIQSMRSVGSGGLIGLGYKNGIMHILKFLPEAHTDFAFASFSEEFGFFGIVGLMFLYLMQLFRILKTAFMAKNSFGFFIAIGFFILYLFQILENSGMNMGILPVTGIPLPFITYGGSSVLVYCIFFGIINSIYARKDNLLTDKYDIL